MTYSPAQMSSYIRQYRQFRRAWGMQQLGGKCVRCDETQGLEFDHIDPKTKIRAVASMLTASWKDFKAEVEKCQLLCRPHHIEKTREDLVPPPIVHGKEAAYRKGCRCESCVTNQQERRRRYR